MAQSGIILPVSEKDEDFESLLSKSIHHIKNTVHHTLEKMLLEEVKKHPASSVFTIESKDLEERVWNYLGVRVDDATLSRYCAEWCVQNFVMFEEVKHGVIYGFLSGSRQLFQFELRCDLMSIVNGTHHALSFYERVRDVLEKLSQEVQKAFERVVLDLVKRRDLCGFLAQSSRLRVHEPAGWSSYSITAGDLLAHFRPAPDAILNVYIPKIVQRYANILKSHGIKISATEPEHTLLGVAGYPPPKVVFTLDFLAVVGVDGGIVGGVAVEDDDESQSSGAVDTAFAHLTVLK